MPLNPEPLLDQELSNEDIIENIREQFPELRERHLQASGVVLCRPRFRYTLQGHFVKRLRCGGIISSPRQD